MDHWDVLLSTERFPILTDPAKIVFSKKYANGYIFRMTYYLTREAMTVESISMLIISSVFHGNSISILDFIVDCGNIIQEYAQISTIGKQRKREDPSFNGNNNHEIALERNHHTRIQVSPLC